MTIDKEVLEVVAEELAECLHRQYMGRASLHPPTMLHIAENIIESYEQAKKPAEGIHEEIDMWKQRAETFRKAYEQLLDQTGYKLESKLAYLDDRDPSPIQRNYDRR